MNCLRKIVTGPVISSTRSNFGLIAGASFHSSTSLHVGQEWRRSRQMPLNPNAYGPFADLPDYTYLDGRPTPAGSGRVKRAIKHRNFAKKIIQLTSEVDFAVERHRRLKQEEQAEKEAILARKLKPKGKQL